MSDVQDAISKAYDAKRQRTPEPEAPTPEQLAKAEAAALDRAAGRGEQVAEGKRFAVTRRAMLGAIDSITTGTKLDADARATIVEQVAKRIGGVTPKAREALAKLVDDAADAIESGERGRAWSLVDDAAATVVNTSPSAGAPAQVVADDDDEDPMALASRIARA
jgi:hypothetical protein